MVEILGVFWKEIALALAGIMGVVLIFLKGKDYGETKVQSKYDLAEVETKDKIIKEKEKAEVKNANTKKKYDKIRDRIVSNSPANKSTTSKLKRVCKSKKN